MAKKKWLSVLLAVMFVLSIIPTAIFATDATEIVIEDADDLAAAIAGQQANQTWIMKENTYVLTPKRVVKDFLIKFTKRPQKKCQKHFHAPDTQASRVTCGRLAVRRKCTHIPAVGRYRVSSAA